MYREREIILIIYIYIYIYHTAHSYIYIYIYIYIRWSAAPACVTWARASSYTSHRSVPRTPTTPPICAVCAVCHTQTELDGSLDQGGRDHRYLGACLCSSHTLQCLSARDCAARKTPGARATPGGPRGRESTAAPAQAMLERLLQGSSLANILEAIEIGARPTMGAAGCR